MTTLFHAPMTCSLAVRFAAAEGDVPLDIKFLDLSSKQLKSGGTLLDTNPLGQVSTLILNDGQVLTENTAILAWVQAHSKNEAFRIDPDDARYYQMLRWIAFVSTELHKQILRIVFYNEATDSVKENFRALAPARFELLSDQLSSSPYLLGDSFSAADAYLSWFFLLAERAGLEPGKYPVLTAYQERAFARPYIRELIQSDRKC